MAIDLSPHKTLIVIAIFGTSGIGTQSANQGSVPGWILHVREPGDGTR